VKTVPVLGSNNVVFFGSRDGNMYALHYSDDDTTPITPPVNPSAGSSTTGDDSLNAGSISGIVIGAVVVVALLLGLCFWIRTRCFKKQKKGRK
jgi:hypothetical protein